MADVPRIQCGAGCGAVDRQAASRPYAYICLTCWLDGWRNDGLLVFNLDPTKLPPSAPGT